jgi:hypothetical protein
MLMGAITLGGLSVRATPMGVARTGVEVVFCLKGSIAYSSKILF